MTKTRTGLVFAFAALLFVSAAAAQPSQAHAQAVCTFYRTLYTGTSGSDVACLQNWLAAQGYYTVGATGYFGPVTQQAVIRWQYAQGMAATGVFTPANYSSVRQLPPLGATYTDPGYPVTSYPPAVYPVSYLTNNGSASDALRAIQNATSAHDAALTDVNRASGSRGLDAQSSLRSAQQDLIAALQSFISGNYSAAMTSAQNSQSESNSASAIANGNYNGTNYNYYNGYNNYNSNTCSNNYYNYSYSNCNRPDVKDAINRAQNDLSDAWNQVNRSSASSNNLRDARNYLQNAQTSITYAQNAYDRQDYTTALNSSSDAESSIKNALSLVNSSNYYYGNSGSRADADSALSNAKYAIDQAWSMIDRSNSSSSRIRTAEDFANQADRKYGDAKNDYSNGNYSSAITKANDARNLANQAMYSL